MMESLAETLKRILKTENISITFKGKGLIATRDENKEDLRTLLIFETMIRDELTREIGKNLHKLYNED